MQSSGSVRPTTQMEQLFNEPLVIVDERVGGLENWAMGIKNQLGTIKTDSEETQGKIAILQSGLDEILNEQATLKRQQQTYQKQLALLRSQVDSGQDQVVNELKTQIQQLETSLEQSLESKMQNAVKQQLDQLRQDFVANKKALESTAKINASLRAQLQSVITDHDAQINRISQWQDAFSNEIQAELAQTKAILGKRIGNIEQKIERSSVLYTLGQKLLKLRESVLNDAFITKELAYYVAPNGETREGLGDLDPLFQWVNENLLTSQASTMLLQGVAGSGKSTFNRFLLKTLWQNPAWQTFKPGQTIPDILIPVFIPLGSSQVNPNNLFNYLTHLPELIDDFTDTELNFLKQHAETIIHRRRLR